MTFCFWFNTDSVLQINPVIGKYTGGFDKDWSCSIGGGRIRFTSEIGGGDPVCREDSSRGLMDQNWHFGVITLMEPNIGLYSDGVSSNSCSNFLNESDSSFANVEIGSVLYANIYFKGILDDIRIYDRILSKDEIEALHTEGTTSSTLLFPGKRNLSLSPNPAPGAFTLRSPQAAIQSLALYDLTGRRLPAEISHDRHEAQVRSSYRGLVIVKVQTDQGMWVQKVRME